MTEYFKRFFKHSFIYAIGNLFNRGAGFLLIPLYTRYLFTEGYGKLEILYSVNNLVRIVLGVMLAHALLRFYYDYTSEKDKKEVVSTAFISSFVICVAGSLAIMLLSPFLARVLLDNQAMYSLFNVVFMTLIFEISQEVSLAFLRIKERSLLFVGVSFLQLVSRVVLNVYMVSKLKLGISGVLVGNLISACLIWFILALYVLAYSGIRVSFEKLKSLLKYSYPLLIAALMSMIILNADKFFLKAYTDLETVGVYGLGYRLALILYISLVQPFSTAYGPFRFSIMDQPDAPRIYSLIFTYFFLVMTFFSLGIAVFSRNILNIFATPAFLDAYKIVPILLVMVVLRGLEYIAQTGMFLRKHTGYTTLITGQAMIINLALNWLLISRYGMYGAAWSLSLSWLFIFVRTFQVSQRFYPVRIEYLRIVKIVAAGLCCFIMSTSIPQLDTMWDVALKFIVFISFIFILMSLGFLRQEERRQAKKILLKYVKMATAR